MRATDPDKVRRPGPRPMTRCVAYLRVSTASQAADGVSLAAQRAKIEAYASLYDLEIVSVEVDAGASAETLDRPALARALEMLRRGEADALLVAKLDRLTRSVRDLDTLIHRWFKGDRALLSVAEQIDTRSAAGRLVLNVLASVSQWEREAIAERTATALAHKKANGEKTGGDCPFGFDLDADGVHLVENPAEQRVLTLIRDLRAEGFSVRKIAAHLNRVGVSARGTRWHPNTIFRLIRGTHPSSSPSVSHAAQEVPDVG